MKYFQRILFSLSLCLMLTLSAIAGGQNRAGTSAAPELTIPFGARYLSMGGSSVAFARGPEAIYWNPAGVDLSERSANAMFAYRSFIADIKLNYLAVTGKFGFGSLGLSLRSLSMGDIPITTEAAPDGTGEIYSPTFFVGGVTYSKQLADRISVGASLNIISENFARVSASGISFDVGVQYQNLVGVEGLGVGVTVRNIGPPMKYGGSGLWTQAQVPGSERGITFYKVEAASFELPSAFDIGLAYTVNLGGSSKLLVTGSYQNNNYSYDAYRIGAEYNYNDMLYLRAGRLQAASASDRIPDIFQNFNLGAGVRFTNVGGTDISVDYAYVPVKDFFTNNHVVAVRVGF